MVDIDEQLKKLAMEAEWQQQQARDIQGQLQNIQTIEIEMFRTSEALKSLKEKGVSLFSLGSGVFAKGELKDINRLLVNVGSNILVEKSIDETIIFLDERKKEIEEIRENLMNEMRQISARLREIDEAAKEYITKREQ
jgi:prefoldin alpha subunit